MEKIKRHHSFYLSAPTTKARFRMRGDLGLLKALEGIKVLHFLNLIIML
jgi:hypothetical protein